MSIPVTFQGTGYNVPTRGESGWASDMTNFILNTALLDDKPTLSSLGAAATLTAVTRLHRVASTGGAVTLHATTPVADGVYAGQRLVISGTSDTDTVKILGSANIVINGDWTSGVGRALTLFWDSTLGRWIEEARTI